MNSHADKTQENKSRSVANAVSENQGGGKSRLQLVDNRPEAAAQRELQGIVNNSQRAVQLRAFQEMTRLSTQKQQQPVQKQENNAGLTDHLKTGMESLSEMSLDDVKAHRKTTEVQASSDTPVQRAIYNSGVQWYSDKAAGAYATKEDALKADLKAGGDGTDLRQAAADLGMLSEAVNSGIREAPESIDISTLQAGLKLARDLGRAAQETIAGRSEEPVSPLIPVVLKNLMAEFNSYETKLKAYKKSDAHLAEMIAASNSGSASSNPLLADTKGQHPM